MNGGIDAVAEFKRNINSDNAKRKADGRTEVQLIELACGPVPEGIPGGQCVCLNKNPKCSWKLLWAGRQSARY